MRNIAVILAGGIGARVGGNTPKQLLSLQDGKSVLEHAVDAFEQSPHIDEVCIVMHPDYIAHAEQMLLANAWQKVRHIIPGGKERWESYHLKYLFLINLTQFYLDHIFLLYQRKFHYLDHKALHRFPKSFLRMVLNDQLVLLKKSIYHKFVYQLGNM